MRIRFVNAGRTSGTEYRADLELDGEIVGKVERGMSQGGYRASDYQAKVGGVIVASGRTMADLRADLICQAEAQADADWMHQHLRGMR